MSDHSKNAKKLLDKVLDNVNVPKEIHIERPKPKKGRFLIGTVIGAAAGAVAGLLLAPKSGKQARQTVERQTRGIRRQAADTAGKVKGELDKRVGQAGSQAGTVATEVTRTARSAQRTTARTAKSATRGAQRTAGTAARGAKRTATTAKRSAKRTAGTAKRSAKRATGSRPASRR